MPGNREFWDQVTRGERTWQEALAVGVGASDAAVAAPEAMRDLKQFYSGRAMWGRAGAAAWGRGRFLPRLGRAALLGPFQSVLPMTPIGMPVGGRGGGPGFLERGMGRLGPGGARAGRMISGAGGTLFRGVTRVMGPLDVALRMAGGQPAWQALPRSMAFFGGFEVGSVVGTAVGAGLGAAVAGPVGVGVGGAVGGLVGGFVGGMATEAAVGLPIKFVEHLARTGRRARGLELGGRQSAAMMTRAAATMRQRSLAAMSRSGMNARSLLGRESVLMHIR